MYDLTTVRPTVLVQWSVRWAPSRTTRVLVLVGARRCALETCGRKKCELRFQTWLNLYIMTLPRVILLWPNFKQKRCSTSYKVIYKETIKVYTYSTARNSTQLHLECPNLTPLACIESFPSVISDTEETRTWNTTVTPASAVACCSLGGLW